MIGKRLGRWLLDRELGHGGMGRVYLAREAPPDADPPAEARWAAVKVLPPALAQEADFLARFEREIEVLRQLDHPNIVRFYDAGSQDDHFFYAMEYVPGRNLEEIRKERGRLPWAEVLDLALQVTPALKHAHDRGIIHRDLKPSNLLWAGGGLKLADFGVAKVFAGEHLTATGKVVGTPEYLSPEQSSGRPVTPRSDLYALGAVLYILLCGRPPFLGKNVVELLHKHQFGQFDRPRKLVPDLPPEFDDLICQLLEKDPAKRPADAAVVHRRLAALQRRAEQQTDRTQLGGSERTLAEGGTDEVERPSGSRGPGPSTLMSQLMRQELERQKYGGPARRLLNHPVVLSLLLALCVGGIVWAFWPPSAAALFARGAALMARDDPDAWEAAFAEPFRQLEERYPDHPYQEQVAEYRIRLETHRQKQPRAPTLRQWRQWYEQREDLPEAVREFIAREILKVDYQPRR